MDGRTALALLVGLITALGLVSCSCEKGSESDEATGKQDQTPENAQTAPSAKAPKDNGSSKGYPTTSGQRPSNSQAWKTDWDAFVVELRSHFGRGAPAEEIGAAFDGQEVRWTGRVEAVEADPQFASVRIAMPRRSIKLPDGGSATAGEIQLFPEGDHVANWRAVPPGTTVRFRTTLRGAPPFPAVRRIPGPGGTWTVAILTEDAELLEVVPNGNQ